MDRLPHLGGLLRPWKRPFRSLRRQLPELNFITIHYLYFILTSLTFAVIFWGSSTPSRSISFTDSLFLAISAMTLAGLNTVNLSTLNSFQQVLLFLLIIMGSAIFVSSFVVHVRRKAFDVRLRSAIEGENRLKKKSSWFERRLSVSRSRDRKEKIVTGSTSEREKSRNHGPDETHPDDTHPDEVLHDDAAFASSAIEQSPTITANKSVDSDSGAVGIPMTSLSTRDDYRDHITFEEGTRFRGTDSNLLHRAFSLNGVGARPSSRRRRRLSMQSGTERDDFRSSRSRDVTHAISDAGSTLPAASRNSNFHDLTEADKLRLGGKEYKAVSFLAWVVPVYFVIWQLLGALALGAYVNNYYPTVSRENGLAPWWVGAFNAVSAFNNSGMSLLDANMTVFNKAIYMLLTMSLLILAGNTCYPIFLRLIVWTMYKTLPDTEAWTDFRDTLKFLLDHPRRCYTNLFPSEHTW